MDGLYVRIIWKTNPTKVTDTRVRPEKLAEYQANLGDAWDDIETFIVSIKPIPGINALEQTKEHVARRSGRECQRHGGMWGEDPTCENCTDENGNPRPLPE